MLLTDKNSNDLAVGTVVWVVYPDVREIVVYRPSQMAKVVGIDGILDGGDVLPGFELAVKDIFRT